MYSECGEVREDGSEWNDLMYTHVIIMCDLYGALLLPEPLCGEPVIDLEKMAQPFLKCC